MVDLVRVGLVLAYVGFVVMIISVLARARRKGIQIKGGGVVMVGPIPIIFGTDAKWASVAISLAIVLILLSLILHLV